MTDRDDYDQRMRARFGFRDSRAAVCPRVVAGKHCLVGGGRRPCVCFSYFHILDHARMWIDERGHHVLTAEPYALDHRSAELAALRDALADLPVVVEVTTESHWYVGTTLLMIRPK